MPTLPPDLQPSYQRLFSSLRLRDPHGCHESRGLYCSYRSLPPSNPSTFLNPHEILIGLAILRDQQHTLYCTFCSIHFLSLYAATTPLSLSLSLSLSRFLSRPRSLSLSLYASYVWALIISSLFISTTNSFSRRVLRQLFYPLVHPWLFKNRGRARSINMRLVITGLNCHVIDAIISATV